MLLGIYIGCFGLNITLYAIACLTDLADGFLARWWGVSSGIGGTLDQIADKVLCWSVLGRLCFLHYTPVVFMVIMVVRDVFVSCLRIFRSVPVTQMSKFKTFVLMAGIGFCIMDKIYVGNFLIATALAISMC